MPRKHKTSKPAASGSRQRPSRKAEKPNLAWLWIGLGVVIIAAMGFVFLRSKDTLPDQVSAPEAYALYQKGAYFLDVRTQDEWNQFHLAKSTLIPLDELKNRMSELPKDKDIVVICHSGSRSHEGELELKQAGFSRVTCLKDGLVAWAAAGYPLDGQAP